MYRSFVNKRRSGTGSYYYYIPYGIHILQKLLDPTRSRFAFCHPGDDKPDPVIPTNIFKFSQTDPAMQLSKAKQIKHTLKKKQMK